MKQPVKPLLMVFAMAAVLTVSFSQGVATAGEVAKLKFSQSGKPGAYPFETLGGAWRSVDAEKLEIDGKEGTISVVTTPNQIQVGDGSSRRLIDARGGVATVALKSAARYAVEFKLDTIKGAAKWMYRRGGFMAGKLGGQQVSLIDDNTNGTYNDCGEDCIVIGNSRCGMPLGHVVKIGKKFFSISVSADGDEITATEETPETGILDMTSRRHIPGEVRMLVIGREGMYFDVARFPKGGEAIPTGEYQIIGGIIANANQRCGVSKGEMKAGILVSATEPNLFEWGGDPGKSNAFRTTFKCYRPFVPQVGPEFQVDSLHVFGVSGEEYVNFVPMFSPTFEVRDRESGKTLLEGPPRTFPDQWGNEVPSPYVGNVSQDAKIRVRSTSRDYVKLLGMIESEWQDVD